MRRASRGIVFVGRICGRDEQKLSPLAKNADIVLLSVKSESPVDGGSLVTKIGQLYIVDVLCAGLMRKNGDRYRDNVDRANKSVIKKLI